MTALTAARLTQMQLAGPTRRYPQGTTATWSGGMLMFSAAGYAVPAADTAGAGGVCGVAEINSPAPASNGANDVEVQVGVFKLNGSGLTQAMVGQAVYVIDDNTVGPASSTTNAIRAGTLVKYESATAGWVLIDGHVRPAGSVQPASAVTAVANAAAEAQPNAVAEAVANAPAVVAGAAVATAVANAVDLASAIALVNDIKTQYNTTAVPLLNELRATDYPAVIALLNDLKTQWNIGVTLMNDIKTQYNAAVTLINDLKAKYNAAVALINELQGIVNKI